MTNNVSYVCKTDYIILNLRKEILIATRILTEATTLCPELTSNICCDAFAAHVGNIAQITILTSLAKTAQVVGHQYQLTDQVLLLPDFHALCKCLF